MFMLDYCGYLVLEHCLNLIFYFIFVLSLNCNVVTEVMRLGFTKVVTIAIGLSFVGFK